MFDFDQHFSFKCFLKIVFVKDALLKKSGSFGHYRHERAKHIFCREMKHLI